MRQLKHRTAFTTASTHLFLASPKGEEGWCYTLEHAALRVEVALQKQQDGWDTAPRRLSCPGQPNSGTVLVFPLQAPNFPEGSCSRSAGCDPEPRASKSTCRRVVLTHLHLAPHPFRAAVKPQSSLIALRVISSSPAFHGC